MPLKIGTVFPYWLQQYFPRTPSLSTPTNIPPACALSTSDPSLPILMIAFITDGIFVLTERYTAIRIVLTDVLQKAQNK